MKQNYVKLSLLLLPLLCLLISCKKEESLHIQEMIEKAIEIGEFQPKEALLILDSIQTFHKLDKNNFMLYQIAIVKAKRNASLEIDKHQIDLIVKASQYFEEQKDLKNTILANFYTGMAYIGNNDLKKGYTYFLKTYPYAESLKDSSMMGKILYNIGSIYFDQQLYGNSSIFLKKSIPFLKNYPQYQVQAYRLIGSNYYLTKDYKNALKYLNVGYVLSKLFSAVDQEYLYNTSYGVVFKDLEQYDKAAMCFRNNLVEEVSKREQLRAALNLTDIYLLSHNSDSAIYYAQEKVIPLLSELEIKNTEDYFLQLFAYRVLEDYYIEQGDKAKIKEYINLYLQTQTQIGELNIAKELITIDKRITIQQLFNLKRKTDESLIFYTFLFVALFLILVVFIVYLIIKKIKKKDYRNRIKELKIKHKFELL